MGSTIIVAKTKALISFAVIAKLICFFVFAYAKCGFSHEMAHLMFVPNFKLLGLVVPEKSLTKISIFITLG